MAKCVDGLRLIFQLLGQIGKLLHLAAVHRLEQALAGWEMPVERADTDAGGSRDSFEACFRSAGTEYDFCRLKNAFAIANGVGPRLS